MIELKEYFETNDKTLPAIRVSESLAKRIEARVKAHKTNKSRYVRAAILMLLSKDEPQPLRASRLSEPEAGKDDTHHVN